MGILPIKTSWHRRAMCWVTHGVEAVPVAVRDAVTHVFATAAERSGMNHGEAVHPVTPEAVAEVIMQAAAQDDQEPRHMRFGRAER